jgi:predicted DNA-binding protein (MmcQ/YjbR family)
MNKEHWISIDLNNKKLIDDEVLSLIRLSFEIVDKNI